MAPDGLAMAHILVGEFLGGGQCERLLFFDGFPGTHRGAHGVHGVDGINRRGSRGLERLINRSNVPRKFLQVAAAKGERALGQSISGGGGNGRRAAHDHVADGVGGFPEMARRDDFEFVRQQSLFDQPNRVARAVKGDGAIMPGAAVDSDVHLFWNRLNQWLVK